MPTDAGRPSADRARTLLGLIAERRSVRHFTPESVPLAAVEVLVDAVAPTSGRALPSAHALDPLRFGLIAHRVVGLESGEYRIRAGGLEPVGPAPSAAALLECCLDRPAWTGAAAVLTLTADPEPVEHFRGQDGDDRRGERFLHLEAGHAAQNLQLAATALGLGIVFIGGIIEQRLAALLSLAPGIRPLGLLPLGTPAPG